MCALDNGGRWEIECDGTRKSGQDKGGERLIERPKERECSGAAEARGGGTDRG